MRGEYDTHSSHVPNASVTRSRAVRSGAHKETPHTCRPSRTAVKAGERIAQLVLERIAIADVVETAELDDTVRGAGAHACSEGRRSPTRPVERGRETCAVHRGA